MRSVRSLPGLTVGLALVALALGAASCQKSGAAGGGAAADRAFGNGFKDPTPVLARVGGMEITRGDLERRHAEMPDNIKQQYTGEGWEKRFLRTMVDEALLFQEAQRRHVDRDPEVAQALISGRRQILLQSMRDRELAKDLKPTEAQIRRYYERNLADFQQLGTMQARHVQCEDEKTARAVYDRLRASDRLNWEFPRVVAAYSRNDYSAKLAGDLGWFNRGGVLPALKYGAEFSELIWDWPVGLHEPVQIGGDWHVVEVLRREPGRQLSLEEARDRVVTALTPVLKRQALEDFLRGARRAAAVEYAAGYAPGGGLDPRELIRLAQMDPSPESQVETYRQVVEDFPDSDVKDDALFLLANAYLDVWGDKPFAEDALYRLLDECPGSEYADQARYLLDHMFEPDFRQPKSPEDLRRGAR